MTAYESEITHFDLLGKQLEKKKQPPDWIW